MAWGVALWSLATFFTPWAAETSLWLLLAMRVLLGVAEGVALPCMNNMIARYFNHNISFICSKKLWKSYAEQLFELLLLDGFLKQNDQGLLVLQWLDFSLEALSDSLLLLSLCHRPVYLDRL